MIKEMLRYMAGTRWQDRVAGEEVAKRFDLREINVNMRQKVAVVRTCKKREIRKG